MSTQNQNQISVGNIVNALNAAGMSFDQALKQFEGGFISNAQLSVIRQGYRKSEEKAYFKEKVLEYGQRIASMPNVYEQDGLGGKAVVYLHYFLGGFDWYILEKDPGMSDEPEVMQKEAFGLACMQVEELGYISLVELTANGVELDLHWTPKTLAEVKAKRAGK